MDHHIMWRPWTEPGLEHLHLSQQQDVVSADGLIIGVHEQQPFRVHYAIQCTPQWIVRAVQVRLLESPSPTLHLLTDGVGNWTTADGEALAMLQGCRDLDISATPFTNTLPLRRQTLAPGEAITLNMIYIAVPEMHMHVAQQRYTCLELAADGGRYRFESLAGGVTTFMAELPVDRELLVLDYPQLFQRVGTWQS